MSGLPPAAKQRSSTPFIAAALLLLVVCVFAVFYALQNTRAGAMRATEASRQDHDIEVHATNLIRMLVDAETGMRGYVLTKRVAYLEPYIVGRANAQAELEQLERVTRDKPDLRPFYEQLKESHFVAIGVIDRTVALGRQNKFAAAQALMLTDEGKRAMDAMRSSRTALQNVAFERAQRVDENVLKARTSIDWLITALGALFTITIAAALYAVYAERAALRKLTEELQAARVQAEESDAAKTRFLALASHDMRQPLHAMTLYLAALRRRVEGEQAQVILTNMDVAAQALTRMFSGLLDLARIESGVLKAKPVDVCLQEIFDAVAVELKDDALRAKVDLRVVHTSLLVRTDPELMESVLRNLVTNALKYAGGGRVVIGARRQGDKVRLMVSDEGPGIPKDKIVFVFGEFVRLDATKNTDGLGLGLSLASRLAKLLGETLEVESQPGKGSTFWVTAPIAEAARDTPGGAHEALIRDLTGIDVAVLDDDKLSLVAMTGVLADAGARVSAFDQARKYTDASDAGEHHHVVIIDPVMLAEASAIVSRRPGYKAPPLIVVTGSTDAATLARLEASKLAWLIKPVKEEKLLDMVAHVARNAGAQPGP